MITHKYFLETLAMFLAYSDKWAKDEKVPGSIRKEQSEAFRHQASGLVQLVTGTREYPNGEPNMLFYGIYMPERMVKDVLNAEWPVWYDRQTD